jgi:hypothetical protein
MFDFTLPYQINERRNLTFQLIFITVGMIAEVGVGDDLRAAAAGRTIVTGEIAVLTTTITAGALLASQWAVWGYPCAGPHHLFGKA